MPILNSILDHKVLGREFKRGLQEGRQEGELTILRRQIQERFGGIPTSTEQWLAGRSTAELEELSVRVLRAQTLDELLK